VHLGNIVTPKIMPNGYMGNPSAAFIFKILADMTGLWLWGLCLWFFIVSVGAHWQVMRPNDPEHHIRFDMTWYSFVFPNTAMVTATQAIGKTFESGAIQVVGTVMAVLLVLVWGFVMGMMVRSFYLRRLLWPREIDGSELQIKRWSERRQSNGVLNGDLSGTDRRHSNGTV
jgi:tellurite resistance protein TehA-like permease